MVKIHYLSGPFKPRGQNKATKLVTNFLTDFSKKIVNNWRMKREISNVERENDSVARNVI